MKQNDIDALFSAAKSGNKKQMAQAGNDAIKGLDDEQKRIVERAMSDPEFLRSVMSTQRAQEIMKKLKGEGE